MNNASNILFNKFGTDIYNQNILSHVNLVEIHKNIISDDFKNPSDYLAELYKSDEAKYKKERVLLLNSVQFSLYNEEYTGLIGIDIDKVKLTEEEIQNLFDDKILNPVLIYRTASQNGLRIITYNTLGKEYHEEIFNELTFYLESQYNLKCDKLVKNINRRFWINYDPNALLNVDGAIDIEMLMEINGINNPQPEITKKVPVDNTNIKLNQNQIEFLKKGFFKNMSKKILNSINGEKHSILSKWSFMAGVLADSLKLNHEETKSKLKELIKTRGELSDIGHAYRTVESCFDDGTKCENTIDLTKYLENTNNIYRELEKLYEKENQPNINYLTNDLYSKLPEILQEFIKHEDNPADKFVMLISSIVACSSLFLDVKGFYGNKFYSPNLCLFVYGKSGVGKGNVENAKRILKPLDLKLKSNKLDLMLPTNSSSAALLKLLKINNGKGIIIAPELDTLTKNFSQDWGTIDDMLRLAGENEDYYSVRNDLVKIHIENLRFSLLLSGTHLQILNLINSPTNGLFSRFLFFELKKQYGFTDPFEEHKMEKVNLMDEIGKKLEYQFSYLTNSDKKYIVEMNKNQKSKFFKCFQSIYDSAIEIYGDIGDSIGRRLALQCFRIIMVLTCLRELPSNKRINEDTTLNVIDDDIDIAIYIIQTLSQSIEPIYNILLKIGDENEKPNLAEIRIVEILPKKFKFDDVKKMVKEQLNYSPKTLSRALLNRQLFEKLSRGYYKNLAYDAVHGNKQTEQTL